MIELVECALSPPTSSAPCSALLFLQQGSMSHVDWGLLLLKLQRLLLDISRVFTAKWDRWMANPFACLSNPPTHLVRRVRVIV
jgi:hypothetical protein